MCIILLLDAYVPPQTFSHRAGRVDRAGNFALASQSLRRPTARAAAARIPLWRRAWRQTASGIGRARTCLSNVTQAPRQKLELLPLKFWTAE